MTLRRKLARLTSAGPGSTSLLEDSPESSPRGSESRQGPPPNSRPLRGRGSLRSPESAEDLQGVGKVERVRKLQRALDGLVSRGRPQSKTGADALAGFLSAQTPPIVRAHSGKELPGERITTPHGDVHVVDTMLEPHHCHGRVSVVSAQSAPAPLVAELALDPSLANIDLSRILLIDTETTGLSVGTGTLPFLIGFAHFEDESLRVRQLLLTQLGHEAPMLKMLAERIAWASCIVSYNGKSFDWPLLRSRYVMNRVPTPCLPPHLDLLHCSRRVFKRRMSSVRLVDMERDLLGFTREHDVGGAEIPGIYLSFLRSRDPGRIDGVIEHNGHDLVALAAILGELTRRFQTVRRQDDPLDHLGYARVAERAGDRERALRFATAAAEGGGDDDCTYDAWMLRARVARKSGDTDAEESALLAALNVKACVAIHVELAKLYEHRQHSLPRALHHAHAANESHRLGRLGARLARRNRRKRPR